MQGKKALRDPDISLSEYAYREVREAIRNGRFTPDSRLRENDLSEMLGISRTPIREAMKRLESEQLVVYRAPRGFVVNSLTLEEVVDLYAIREILEGSAARFAAMHASSHELYEMKSLLEMQHATSDDPEKMARLNEEFHRSIYKAAHNRFLLSALSSLGDALRLLTRTTFAAPNRGKTALKEHQKVFDAISKGDADLAEKCARLHIQNAGAIRFKMISEDNLMTATKLVKAP
jgi:DNA-binding GntR family transcriptional regulator